MVKRLGELKTEITKNLTGRSPLEIYEDAEPYLREKWEDELAAGIEAEYRRQRAEILTGLQWWLRDIWLAVLNVGTGMLSYPEMAAQAQAVARRISVEQAMENLQVMGQTHWLLGSNVQEALVLEVGLLQLRF